MLCRNLKHIIPSRASEKYRLLPSRHFSHFSRRCIDKLFAASKTNMSAPFKLRHIFKDLFVSRLLNAWRRSCFVISVVKKTNKDLVVQYFRQALFRPRRTLLFTVTAAYKNNEEKPGPPGPCGVNISDEELSDLLIDLEAMEAICQATLYCPGCERRVVIDNRQPGVRYCECDHTKSPEKSFDGWEPFMEAEDVIIWRKEYKPGPLYAYKVYGRYKHLRAEDFAAIQIDGGYRKVWDSAVASLSTVERDANGQHDQSVLHWEVLWPRLFANRDYVYLRRHKEFTLKSRQYKHKDRIFDPEPPSRDASVEIHDRPNVHSNAKRKALEDYAKEQELLKSEKLIDNKVYVIVSRSCTHDDAPVTSKAIRVTEYWSHMVIKTLNGPGKPGMEFVLTYYDEPAVGGLPAAVTAWAMGRAGPAFLERMRKAAQDYTGYRERNPPDPEDGPTDFSPKADPTPSPPAPASSPSPPLAPGNAPGHKKVDKVSMDVLESSLPQLFPPISELEMETSKQGPELSEEADHRDQATQTDGEPRTVVLLEIQLKDATRNVQQVSAKPTIVQSPMVAVELKQDQNLQPISAEDDETDGEDQQSWWRYVYPFYYFS